MWCRLRSFPFILSFLQRQVFFGHWVQQSWRTETTFFYYWRHQRRKGAILFRSLRTQNLSFIAWRGEIKYKHLGYTMWKSRLNSLLQRSNICLSPMLTSSLTPKLILYRRPVWMESSCKCFNKKLEMGQWSHVIPFPT